MHQALAKNVFWPKLNKIDKKKAENYVLWNFIVNFVKKY